VRLLYAELLKVRTAPRTTVGLVLGLLLLVGLSSAATASSADSSPFFPETAVTDVITTAAFGVVFALILGILIVTWEYRHGTITQTFLATPRRERVIGAKFAIALLSGAILAAAALAVALAAASFWISVDLDRSQWELVGRVLLTAALWGVLGAGLGAVLQSQVGAIVTAFVWFLVAEPLLGTALDALTDASVSEYLPGGVVDRLHNVDQQHYAYGLWVGALLAVAYAAGFALLGTVSAVRRDVP
jgi:ABC-type transport system involved in multi-copper enzyme maturation permease subunit